MPSSLPLPLRNQPAPHLVEAADAVVHVSPEQALRQVLVLDHGQLERVALQPRVVVAAGRREGRGGEGPGKVSMAGALGELGRRADEQGSRQTMHAGGCPSLPERATLTCGLRGPCPQSPLQGGRRQG